MKKFLLFLVVLAIGCSSTPSQEKFTETRYSLSGVSYLMVVEEKATGKQFYIYTYQGNPVFIGEKKHD